MTESKEIYPKITRPGEYLAFINFKVPTEEGIAYVFMACDGYSKYAFHISAEKDESPMSILKAVYLLTEDEDFLLYRDEGFTLVFDRYKELSKRIEAVVKPVAGKVLYNKKFHEKIARPLVKSINDLLENGPR